MQEILRPPVKVNINIEQESTLTQDAFKTVCFIHESDSDVERSIRLRTLQDVVDAGFMRSSTLYNFCRSVFKQNTNIQVVSRVKRTAESYEEAYIADSNDDYYYVVIESKVVPIVLAFNDFIANELKLQFFSTDENVSDIVGGRKLVYWWQPYFSDYLLYDSDAIVTTDSSRFIELSTSFYPTADGTDSWLFDNYIPASDIVSWDTSYHVLLEFDDYTEEEADTTPYYYPEAAWIARCGWLFPSRIQWLYKTLVGASVFDLKEIPLLSNSYTTIKGNQVTVGTGTTTRGYPIDQEVGLDWVKWAIQKNCWSLLYSAEKVNATQNGLLQFEQRVKEPLDIAVRENLFSSYSIKERNLDRIKNSVSFKFTATLLYSILGVDQVEGSIYQ